MLTVKIPFVLEFLLKKALSSLLADYANGVYKLYCFVAAFVENINTWASIFLCSKICKLGTCGRCKGVACIYQIFCCVIIF